MDRNKNERSIAACTVFLACVLFASCSLPLAQGRGSVLVTLQIPETVKPAPARFIHPDAASATVTVSGADMATVTETASVSGTSNTVTIELTGVPSGSSRTISVTLVSEEGTILAEGSSETDIIPETTNRVSITLRPAGAVGLALGVTETITGPAGKTFMYAVELPSPGAYTISVLAAGQSIKPSLYNSAGSRIALVQQAASLYGFTAAVAETCYAVVTMTAAFAGSASLSINTDAGLSSAKAITSFVFAAPPGAGTVEEAAFTITVTVPYGTDLTALSPAITHTGSSVAPASGVPRDFTNPAEYTVTAADGSTQIYTVTVTPAVPGINADLSSLTVTGGTLNPAFTPAVTAYTLIVANDITSVTVTGTKADVNATSTGTVILSGLVAGVAQTAVITVIAQDGTTTIEYTVEVTRSPDYNSPNIGILKFVPPGTFNRDGNYTSTITAAYRMSRYEITRAQYAAVMGVDPGNAGTSSGITDPVQMTGWYHALAFCNMLSIAEGLTPVYTISGSTVPDAWDGTMDGIVNVPVTMSTPWDSATETWTNNGYRLPTEMEWMWAAMGASDASTGYLKAFAGSTGSNAAVDYAWFIDNTTGKTHPSGAKLPNELGIFDMSGNVWEWCWDWYAAIYPAVNLTDYRGGVLLTYRVQRGGYWSSADVSVASRSASFPYANYSEHGFRVVRP